MDKELKSSSTGNENIDRRSSFQRRSGQEAKRNSHLITDETVVTSLILDSSKNRQQNGKVIRSHRSSLSRILFFFRLC